MTTTPSIARLETLAMTWQRDASKRKAMSTLDAGADVLAYCADELLSELRDLAEADEELSAAAYADLHGKAVSTVRRWCRTGALLARREGRDYVIRRGEPCPTFAAAA